MKRVIFVCLGNICRSPAAEGFFIDYIKKSGKEDSYIVDSAGTCDHHIGELPDSRMRKHSQKRGVELMSKARQFVSEDFQNFDLVIVMDDSNLKNVKKLANNSGDESKVFKLTDFSKTMNFQEVPDPYYGGDDGFELVLDLIVDSLENIDKKLNAAN